MPCLLCGADKPRPLFEKEGFTFVQCAVCDFIYVNPQLREDAVRDFYEDDDHSTLIEQLVASSNDYRKERFGKERLDIVESFAKRSPGRLLDVGCTTGFFLEAAAERGWDAHGMELNPYAAQVALAKGLQVRQQMIEEADYEPESFDAMTIFDVVEHVREAGRDAREGRVPASPGAESFFSTRRTGTAPSGCSWARTATSSGRRITSDTSRRRRSPQYSNAPGSRSSGTRRAGSTSRTRSGTSRSTGRTTWSS